MKLIDILARELKVWPQGVDAVEQSDLDCSLFEYGRGIIGGVKTHAEDSRTAKVTRAQWQAAVDALKVESAPAWVGVGLPPAGTVCIITPHNTLWGFSSVGDYQCMVLAYHDDFVWVELVGVLGVPVATRTDKVDFNLLRTPEQVIADREREERIKSAQVWLEGIAQTYGADTADKCEDILMEFENRKQEAGK